MRILLISIVVFCNTIIGFAQMIDLDKGRTTKIEIVNIHGDLKIEGVNANRILIERIKYNPVPESIREPLEDQGYKKSDLDDLSIQNVGNKLIISPANIKGQFADYQLKVPKDMIISIKTDVKILYKKEWNIGNVFSLVHNNININSVDGEIEISTYTSIILLQDIKGPITCDLYEGEISAIFLDNIPAKKSTLSIFEGKVNVYLPEKVSCFVDLNIGSDVEECEDYGACKINSDFDIQNASLKSSEYTSNITKGDAINKKAAIITGIKGQINDGGSCEFTISAYFGEINLLKK